MYFGKEKWEGVDAVNDPEGRRYDIGGKRKGVAGYKVSPLAVGAVVMLHGIETERTMSTNSIIISLDLEQPLRLLSLALDNIFVDL